MTFLTRCTLVLLRLAIGWHFLIEGLEKLDSHYHFFHHAVEGKAPWSSEGYLKESSGPLSHVFREQAGDPNRAALERLAVPPAQPGKPRELPPALAKDWQDYFARFVAHYGVGDVKAFQPELLRVLAVAPGAPFPADVPWPALAPGAGAEPTDKIQLVLAKVTLDHAGQEALNWLLHGERETVRSFARVTEKVRETTPDRIKAYRADLQQLREIEDYGLRAFGKDVWKKKLADLKKKVAAERAELLAEVNRPMREAMEFTHKHRLTKAQQDRGPLPQPETRGQVWWINQVTMWGLTAVGACLLLGLCTRTACVAGAGFLLMFYLPMPALPWLPANPRAEGHYLFINKNIIEMLALLALATTASGRWAGLDGLIYVLNPWRRLRDEPRRVTNQEWAAGRASATGPRSEVGTDLPPPSPPSPVKEPAHGP